MTQRGDVVVVQFPYVDRSQGKNRPAVVVQCNRNNQRLLNTLVAIITGNTRRASTEPTQVLIDPGTPEGQSSGLSYRSAVKCENLYTVAQKHILRTVGRLSPILMQRVDASLKSSLELP